jgi:hypothetical protein
VEATLFDVVGPSREEAACLSIHAPAVTPQ